MSLWIVFSKKKEGNKLKPLTLRLKNFGPYIDETIDFTNFEESSLFLISGKTGAGKTTIFDGMSYALFGESSGKLRQGKELRSTFADPSEPTEVQLLFSHGEFLYEITRKPEQELFKKRGDGTRTQPAKISLIIKSPAGKELKEYTKRREVDSFVQELLHLDAEQFSQIVLLPQGEFRTFLIANSSEKEKVLRRLFSTQMYQALSEELKQQSKVKNQEIEQIRQKIEMKMEQIHWEEEPQEELTEKRLQLLAQQQKTSELKQEQLKKQIDQLKEELKLLEQKKMKIEEQNKLAQEYETLLTEQISLSLKQEDITALKQTERALLWVKTQENLLDSLEDSEQELADNQKKLVNTAVEKESLERSLMEYQEKANMLNERQKEMDKQQLVLNDLKMRLPLYEEREALEKELSTELLEQLEAKLAAEQEKNEELVSKQQKLLEELSLSPQLENQLLILERAQKDWQKILEDWQALISDKKRQEEQQERIATLQEQLSQAEVQRTNAEKERKDRQAVWARMQISRLSLLLEDGEPCPVCGAMEHPNAAVHQEVSLEDIQEAEQQLNEAERVLKLAEEKVTSLAKDIEAAENQKKQFSGELATRQEKILKVIEELAAVQSMTDVEVNEEWIEEEKNALQSELEETLVKLSELEDKKRQEATLKEQIDQQRQLLSELDRSYGEKLKKQQTVEVKLETVLKQLDSQLTFPEALEKKQLLEKEYAEWQLESEQTNKKLMAYKEQDQHLAQTAERLEQDIQRLQRVLENGQEKMILSIKENDFSYQLAEVRELLGQLKDLPDIQNEIASFEEKSKEISFRIQDIKKKLDASQLPELAEVDNQLEEKGQEISEQESVYYQKKEKLLTNELIQQEIVEAIGAVDKKWVEVAALQQLADTINGDNLKKTSLERYVLQTYLREVLKTANIRMASLTNSRYQFELNSEKNSYKNQTGLEINIYDDNAGASRSARTLSGGESFIAALALALSLAEVIQEQAGGVLIEALFIDEGFGSLDEEALEMAIEALETIENEGRMIGIISHVAELKSRISQQLQIKTNGAGQSSVSYQVM